MSFLLTGLKLPQHDNIVELIGVYSDHEQHFIIMELMDGKSERFSLFPAPFNMHACTHTRTLTDTRVQICTRAHTGIVLIGNLYLWSALGISTAGVLQMRQLRRHMNMSRC